MRLLGSFNNKVILLFHKKDSYLLSVHFHRIFVYVREFECERAWKSESVWVRMRERDREEKYVIVFSFPVKLRYGYYISWRWFHDLTILPLAARCACMDRGLSTACWPLTRVALFVTPAVLELGSSLLGSEDLKVNTSKISVIVCVYRYQEC